MKEKIKKKLILNKETISKLNKIKGGIDGYLSPHPSQRDCTKQKYCTRLNTCNPG